MEQGQLPDFEYSGDEDYAAAPQHGQPQPQHQPKRKMGMCKKRDYTYIVKTATQQESRQRKLAMGEARITPQATLAAHTRARQYNQSATLSRFFTQIGSILDTVSETGEDATARMRDAYLAAASDMTKKFGRVLPSNRCADPSISVIHQQITKLVHAGIIQPLCASDPALQDNAAAADMTVQLVGQGPVRAPQPMLPPLNSPAPMWAAPSPPPLDTVFPAAPLEAATNLALLPPLASPPPPTFAVLPTLVMTAPIPPVVSSTPAAAYIESALASSSPVNLEELLRTPASEPAPKKKRALVAVAAATAPVVDNFF